MRTPLKSLPNLGSISAPPAGGVAPAVACPAALSAWCSFSSLGVSEMQFNLITPGTEPDALLNHISYCEKARSIYWDSTGIGTFVDLESHQEAWRAAKDSPILPVATHRNKRCRQRQRTPVSI
jgi:hypothetical protein